ncbi:hypothetical protein UlMin_037880 [Ulmus minor]
MGSLEEERLVQMVHDFIESDTQGSPFSSHQFSSKGFPQAKYFTLQDIIGYRSKVEGEVLERVLKHIKNKREAAKFTCLRNYLVMKLKLDGYDASLCHTSWVTSFGCPAGNYEFLDIIIQDKDGNNPTRLIVDIDFRSQFELARPTPAYKQLTDALPNIFIGTEDKLIQIISLLCSAAKQSLRDRGLHVPPWRTTSYMQSKWLASSISPKQEQQNPKIADQHSFSNWAPPIVGVKPNKRRDLGGGGSGLSCQFSNMSINCC